MLKRSFDVLVSAVGLILLSPVLLVVAVAGRAVMGPPVLFRQDRPGRGGHPFVMYKFRTMGPARRPDGQLIPEDERVTRLGRFLRSTSLDELPELLNVLKGDMSIVGPRPLLMEYLQHYTTEQARRHEVRPGITGWAQINGRNELDWEERFKLDVWYVDHQSFALDLRIMLATVGRVLLRRGINTAEGRIMPPFRGSAATDVDRA